VKLRRRSRTKRIGFSLVVAGVFLLCGSILFVSATVAYAVRRSVTVDLPASAAQNMPQGGPGTRLNLKTFHGMLTDSFCGARHVRTSGRSSTECTRICVRQGADYVLANSEGNRVLRGNRVTLNRLAGQRVTVTGVQDANAIHVRSIRAGD
jgi:hypothetical protein